MKTAALIFGLLAGLLGGLVLAFGTIQSNLAALPAFGSNSMLIARLLVYLVPAIGWIGTGIVMARPRLGSLGLLLSAAGWLGLALAAGHGAVLFAAPPFTFAAAAGVVAAFVRRNADRGELSGASPSAAPAAKLPREAALPRAEPPPRQIPPPVAAPPSEPEAGFAAPIIPPPFQDEIPDDETPADNLPDDDPAAPIIAAMATQTLAIAPDAARQAAVGAEPVAPFAAASIATGASPARAADPGAAALRARRPGEWSLPSPADAPAPRYAAERQAAPTRSTVSAPMAPPEGQPDAGAPSKPMPMSQAAMLPLAIDAPPARISVPAPMEPPKSNPSAMLDFAPTDDYGRSGGPLAEPATTIEAPREQGHRRKPASRALIDDETDAAPPRAAPVDRRGIGLRGVLRGTIAAVFVLALIGICSAVYFDYMRGPKSILFGQRGHETRQSQTAPPTMKMATAAPAARSPASTPATPRLAGLAAAAPMPGSSVKPPAAPVLAADTAPPSLPAAAPIVAATSATETPGIAASPTAPTFSDPVRYCAAVRTIDAPDTRYVGPALPPAVATALLLPKSTAASQVRWRCAGGVAFACNASNGDTCSPTPTVQYMLQYCAAHPGAGTMPAPNGSWSCNGKRPVIPDDQSWPVDGRGFYPDAWVRVSPIGAG